MKTATRAHRGPRAGGRRFAAARAVWLSCAALALSAGVLRGQDPAPPVQPAGQSSADVPVQGPGAASGQTGAGSAAPVLLPNREAALRAFETSLDQPYQLGRGDEIAIAFTGRPELSTKAVIGPDGKITLPLAGSIELADKTREQAAEAVTKALSPYYADLSVTVGVDRYTSDQVLLLGAVEHPGIQTFDRPPTLLEVVARGGSTDRDRNGGSAVGSAGGGAYSLAGGLLPPRLGVPERCAIYRGSDQVIWVDLKALLDSGSPLADLRLKRDDIVYVPSSAERYISILGQVQHPGALELDNNSTLPKLLALAGGLTPQAGHYPDIQIIQPATGKTRVISFKQVLQPGSLDLTLHSGDVIFVPESGFNRAAYVIDKLSPLVTMFTAAAIITQ